MTVIRAYQLAFSFDSSRVKPGDRIPQQSFGFASQLDIPHAMSLMKLEIPDVNDAHRGFWRVPRQRASDVNGAVGRVTTICSD